MAGMDTLNAGPVLLRPGPHLPVREGARHCGVVLDHVNHDAATLEPVACWHASGVEVRRGRQQISASGM